MTKSIETLKEMADEEEVDEEEVSEEEEVEEMEKADEEEKADETYEQELKEAYATIESLRGTINEVNLLNAKLLYTNKLFRTFDLNESQKVKVIENFDRACKLKRS